MGEGCKGALANAAEVLSQLTEKREPLVITQYGEAKAVIQDVAS